MPTDPNRARDKALEDVARYLKSIDNTLQDIAKTIKRRSGGLRFNNYQEGEPRDSTNPAGGIKPTDPSAEPQEGPYGAGTSQPYS